MYRDARHQDPNPTGTGSINQAQWDYLDGPAEMPRYATIFGYARASNSHASVLDVGCGAGILLHWLDRDIERYVGIDLSSTAIEQARSQHLLDSARFEVADAATFNTNDRFDIIVLNEILYYMNSPDSLLYRYENFLKPDGTLIISMQRSAGSMHIWSRCRLRLEVLNEVLLTSGKLQWHIWRCKLKATNPQIVR